MSLTRLANMIGLGQDKDAQNFWKTGNFSDFSAECWPHDCAFPDCRQSRGGEIGNLRNQIHNVWSISHVGWAQLARYNEVKRELMQTRGKYPG